MASGKSKATGIKPAASKVAAASDASTGTKVQEGPTRCDQGGDELIVTIIPVKQGEPVELDLTLCRSSFLVRVFLDDKKLFDDTAQDQLVLPLEESDLNPGLHTLTWAYLPANSDSWQVRSEVKVSDGVRFLMRKGAPESDVASNQRFVLLRVQ